jgi:subtilisin-like proprotein convertase family protein
MRRQITLSILILVFSLILYSSQKNKLKDIYEITEEKVYAVRISIPTMADLEKLKDLGIVCRSPGKLTIKVTEAKFEELNEAGYEVDIVKRAIEVQGKRKSLPVTKSREINSKSDANPFDYDIPETSGVTWATSDTDIWLAPSGALVRSIDVYYEIIHPYVGELIVILTNGDEDIEHYLWSLEGGSQTNIYETETGILSFNREPVNQTWRIHASDYNNNDNEGYIDYWKITVYYGEPDLVITNIAVSNNQPWADESIDVSVTIKNQGDGFIPEGSYYSAIFYNETSQPSPPATGDRYMETDDDDLEPGESATYTFSGVTTNAPGMWNMYGLVDNFNYIAESNESNNGYGPVEVFWKERPEEDLYNWPIKNPTLQDQSPMNGGLNEFRSRPDGTNQHFHQGIDIHGVSEVVYAVSAGPYDPHPEATYPYVRVGRFRYVHLALSSFPDDIDDGDWINSGTIIGETDGENHVHFEDGNTGSQVNPLRADGITPYLDTEPPQIIDVSLVRDGTLYETIDPNNVNGKVDIIVHARDEYSNHGTTGPKAVYRIGYHIVDVHSGPIYNIQFDNWLSSDNLTYVYAIDESNLTTMGNHYYIVTNNMTSNNYLNTAALEPGTYTLRITAQDIKSRSNGKFEHNTTTHDMQIRVIPTGVEEKKNIPKTFAIHQNFPNPFSQKTEINYQLPEECNVELAIYNIIGERVKTLTDENQSPGYYNMHWSGKDYREEKVPAGTYFLIFKAGKFQDHKKIVKLQ